MKHAPRVITADGYAHIYLPTHRLARKTGYVREHLVIAEKALGKPIPDSAVVHHHNENRSDNTNTNLVICENNAYHKHLHWRMRTNGGTEKRCKHCLKVKPLTEFTRKKPGSCQSESRCKPCRSTLYMERYYAAKREVNNNV